MLKHHNITFGLVAFDVSTSGWTHPHHAISTFDWSCLR